MKPYRQQIAKARSIAQQALAEYRLSNSTFKLLHHGENTTFKVTTPRNKHYLLRLHRDGYQSNPAIRSELQWLQQLQRNTDLHIQTPVTTKNNKLVAVVQHSEGKKNCSLLHWQEGRFETWKHPQQLFRVGQLLARLHQHSQTYKPPRNFDRPFMDYEGLVGKNAYVSIRKFKASKSVHELKALVCKKLKLACKQLGQNKDCFGVIHADLHQKNCVIANGELKPFDFDDCGQGYFLYDIVIPLMCCFEENNYTDLEESFFAGYETVLDFPGQQRQYLPLFMATRLVIILHWLYTRMDEHERFAKGAPPYIKLCIKQLRRLCKKI